MIDPFLITDQWEGEEEELLVYYILYIFVNM
jgi:hypothetical protein